MKAMLACALIAAVVLTAMPPEVAARGLAQKYTYPDIGCGCGVCHGKYCIDCKKDSECPKKTVCDSYTKTCEKPDVYAASGLHHCYYDYDCLYNEFCAHDGYCAQFRCYYDVDCPEKTSCKKGVCV